MNLIDFTDVYKKLTDWVDLSRFDQTQGDSAVTQLRSSPHDVAMEPLEATDPSSDCLTLVCCMN